MISEDAAYVGEWSEASAFFRWHYQSLTIREPLELHKYQSFEYERRANHSFVEGTLNDKPASYMIDTGADGYLPSPSRSLHRYDNGLLPSNH